MKAIKRIVAVTVAMATMISIGSALNVSAEELTFDDATISSEDYEFLAKRLEQLQTRDTTYVYPEFTSYSDSHIAATTQHLAVFNAASLQSCYFNMYVNKNLTTNSPSSTTYYKPTNRIDSADLSYSTSTYSLYRPHAAISGSLPAYSLIYDFAIGKNTGADSQYDLFASFSSDSNNPTITITNTRGVTTYKCVYAKADGNRDGQITSADVDIVLAYVTENITAGSGRTTAEATFDEMAFIAACDCNGDGNVTITDVITISQVANGTGTI